MTALRRAWADMRQGRNVGVYVAIVAAFGLAVAGPFGLADDGLLRAATLALLGAVCVGLLSMRHQNEELGHAISGLKERSLADRFLRPDCDIGDIADSVKDSREVWLWGTTLTTHIPGLSDDIRSALPRGLRMRVLVIKPSSGAIKMAAFRSCEPDGEDAVDIEQRRLERTLLGNLDLLSSLAKRGGVDRLECKVVDFVGPYVLYAFDPYERHGRLMVRMCNFRGSHDDRPTFWLTRADDRAWFEHFVQQFEAVWDVAEAWNPPDRIRTADQD